MNAQVRHESRHEAQTPHQPSPPLELFPVTVTRDDQRRDAANQSRARGRFEHFRDPLWFIAIGMGVFFAVTAFLIAFG